MNSRNGQSTRSRSTNKQKKADLSKRQLNTQLFEPDQIIFDSERSSKWASDADLLRHIVHLWAKKKRLTADDTDDVEMAVRRAHENIVSEQLEPVKESVALILQKVSRLVETNSDGSDSQRLQPATTLAPIAADLAPIMEILRSISGDVSTARNEISTVAQTVAQASSQQGEQLSLQEVLLQRLQALGKSHFMLSAQSFAALWATLDFIQRYIAEPMLKSLEKEDPFEASITHRDDARKEGLVMVIEMCKLFQFPGTLEMVLVSPPEES